MFHQNTALLQLLNNDFLGPAAVPCLPERFFRGEAGQDIFAGVLSEFFRHKITVFVKIADGFSQYSDFHAIHHDHFTRLLVISPILSCIGGAILTIGQSVNRRR